MPKVELHVHLEGSIAPETLILIARRNGVALPVQTTEDLKKWYRFSNFPHFLSIYKLISGCLRSAEDIELIARQFLAGQAAQNVHYSEVIFTPFTHYESKWRIPFQEQMAALARAREWASEHLNIKVGWVPDISREKRPAEHALSVAEWAIEGMKSGVIALGLGGPEVGNPPDLFEAAFRRARSAGLASLPHAGETDGPRSIWGAVEVLKANRIGHGVRCLEDPHLVAVLRDRQIPLDVSPTSNICLGVMPNLREHSLPRLINEGLLVTINSDDPPMFSTTLTKEYIAIASAFEWDAGEIEQIVMNGVRASLLTETERKDLENTFRRDFAILRKRLSI